MTSEKIRVMDRLKVAWLSSPHERLGQFLYNTLANGDGMERIFYMTDAELIAEVEQYVITGKGNINT